LAFMLYHCAKACGATDGSEAVNATVVWLSFLRITVLDPRISVQPEKQMKWVSFLLFWHVQFRADLFLVAFWSGLFSTPHVHFRC
jgi:hypothetical protein